MHSSLSNDLPLKRKVLLLAAGRSAIFFMIGAAAEKPSLKKDGSMVDACPGLRRILKNHPNLDTQDLNFTTPLTAAIREPLWDNKVSLTAVKLLVSYHFVLIIP